MLVRSWFIFEWVGFVAAPEPMRDGMLSLMYRRSPVRVRGSIGTGTGRSSREQAKMSPCFSYILYLKPVRTSTRFENNRQRTHTHTLARALSSVGVDVV